MYNNNNNNFPFITLNIHLVNGRQALWMPSGMESPQEAVGWLQIYRELLNRFSIANTTSYAITCLALHACPTLLSLFPRHLEASRTVRGNGSETEVECMIPYSKRVNITHSNAEPLTSFTPKKDFSDQETSFPHYHLNCIL